MDDLTTVATKGAFDAIGELCKDLVKSIAGQGKKELQKLSISFEGEFQSYLDRNLKRISRIKTLLNPKNPTLLESVFESPNLSIGDKRFDEEEFLNFVKEHRFVAVTGMGGSGKSVFLRHIFIRMYNEAHGLIPIYIELRNIPHNSNLKEYIHRQIQATVPSFDNYLFDYSLNIGKFIFLLDGLDEVDPSFIVEIGRQVGDFTYQYGQNAVIVASRPDRVFEAWNEFYTAEMQSFSQKQVLSLVRKLRFDAGKKKLFREAIKNGLYNTHGAYLANPLLCTIMLLTFSEGGGIPTKMHVFYQRAFDVLYYQHDASKPPSYQRTFRSNLEIDDFKNAFEAFCFFSYIDYGSSISNREAIVATKKALSYVRIDKKSEDFIFDLCTSISIMLREGDQLSFIHRSFQEYFVALFLGHHDFEGWELAVEKICIAKPNDQVVKLLANINKDKFDELFLRPRITDLENDISNINIESDPAEMMNFFYLGFTISLRSPQNYISSWTIGTSAGRAKWTYILSIIERDTSVSSHQLRKMRDSYQNFDWSTTINKTDQANVVRTKTDYVEITAFTNDFIIATPLHDWLKTVKAHVSSLALALKENAANKDRLLSDALLKIDKR